MAENETENVEVVVTKPEEKKEQEVDYTKIDPSKIPHHVIKDSAAFQGLLGEVQELRLSNRDLQQSVNLLNAELQRKDSDEELNPDEPLTVRQAQQMLVQALDAQRTEIVKDKEKSKNEQQIEKENLSMTRLRENFTIENSGEGLDADTVLREGGSWLMNNKPKLFEAARTSEDPAREIYELALTYVPSIKKKIETKKHSAFLETIQRGTVPKGSGAKPESTGASDMLKAMEMPEDELLNAIEKDELGEE